MRRRWNIFSSRQSPPRLADLRSWIFSYDFLTRFHDGIALVTQIASSVSMAELNSSCGFRANPGLRWLRSLNHLRRNFPALTLSAWVTAPGYCLGMQAASRR